MQPANPTRRRAVLSFCRQRLPNSPKRIHPPLPISRAHITAMLEVMGEYHPTVTTYRLLTLSITCNQPTLQGSRVYCQHLDYST
jgi:hypothetical protein